MTDIEFCYNNTDFVCLCDAIPDLIIDPRYYRDFNFVGERIDGYEEECLLFSRKGANALAICNERAHYLGYRMKIYDAYRPMRAVAHFLRWMHDDSVKTKEHFYPDIDKSEIVSAGYISPRSAHARGSAIDLTLVDMASGEDLDMGGEFDFFGERSHLDYVGLTEQQRKNRHILREIMQDGGFRGISCEWWHFILKDEPFADVYFDFAVKKY